MVTPSDKTRRSCFWVDFSNAQKTFVEVVFSSSARGIRLVRTVLADALAFWADMTAFKVVFMKFLKGDKSNKSAEEDVDELVEGDTIKFSWTWSHLVVISEIFQAGEKLWPSFKQRSSWETDHRNLSKSVSVAMIESGFSEASEVYFENRTLSFSKKSQIEFRTCFGTGFSIMTAGTKLGGRIANLVIQ